MINGLQVVTHMPLFKIKSPGNVNSFTLFLAELSNCDLVDTDELMIALDIYIPEMDALTLNY